MRLPAAILLLLVLDLAGCASSPSSPGTVAYLLPPALRGADVIVIGEVHGTNEAPRAVGDVVAQLARLGPVALALEIPRDIDRDLRAYMASDGGPGAREALLRGAFWQRRPAQQDGRGSVAMFALIERMRVLRASGADVRIAAFDAASGAGAVHERTLADQATLEMRAGQVLVVLTGNVHAIHYPGEAVPPRGESMAKMMPQPVVTLVARGRGGSAWTCIRRECGSHEGMAEYQDASRDGRIDLHRIDGYDGEIFIGPVTASPPAAAR